MLYSCSHDKRVALTDLETCEQIQYFTHPHSVWGIHPHGNYELVSVGLFREGRIWDVRIGRVVQNWAMEKNESSFVTAINENELVMGDGNLVKLYDRRKGQLKTRGKVFQSAEAIVCLNEYKIVVGGRGGDLSLFQTDCLVPPSPSLPFQFTMPEILVDPEDIMMAL